MKKLLEMFGLTKRKKPEEDIKGLKLSPLSPRDNYLNTLAFELQKAAYRKSGCTNISILNEKEFLTVSNIVSGRLGYNG